MRLDSFRNSAFLFVLCVTVLVLGSLPAFADGVTVQGTCLTTCPAAALNPGGSTSGSFSTIYTFGDGDTYRVSGTYASTESADGYSISMDPVLVIRYIGSTPAAGTDTFSAQFLQDFNVPFTAGIYYSGISGSYVGKFGGGTSVSYINTIDGTTVGSAGPYNAPSPFSYSISNVSGPGGPSLSDEWDYTVVFGAGTTKSSTVYIDTNAVTPEPGSLLLLGSGVLGVLGVVRRKLLV